MPDETRSTSTSPSAVTHAFVGATTSRSYTARWFVLAQTGGAELPEPSETLQTPTIIARQSDRPHVAALPPEVVDDVWVQPRHPATEEDDSEPTLH